MFPWAAVHPLLLWGSLAVAAPIIIHLLSKRKFRILDWAAMDFLLEAERKNRRRVQLENILILLLRCLAIALLALLAARPFFQPQSTSQLAGEGAGFERVFVLDDSASMQALGDNKRIVFDAAKESLAAFIESLAESHPSDRVTVLTTSAPESPLFNARFLKTAASEGGSSNATEEGAAEIARTIKALEPTDRVADLDRTLLAVEKLLRADADQINRVVYILSDFRKRDWVLKTPAGEDRGPIQLIKKKIAPNALAVQLNDVGSDDARNLVVTGIRVLDEGDQPNAWVAGVPAKIVVTVKNTGPDAVDKVDVELAAGDAGTQRLTIDAIRPGEEQPATFTVTLTPETDGEPKAANLLVRASIDRADVLRTDNERLLAGRVSPGVKVLIVDGDQGEDPREGERAALMGVLNPAGYRTRFKVDWANDAVFGDGLNLDQYECIFICNVYRLPEEQIANLDKWVHNGGGLVFALGNRIDEQFYNEKLYQEGKGLLPLRIAGKQGDEKGENLVAFAVENANHPMWNFLKQSNIRPETVKISQWWRGELPKETTDSKTTVAAKITDPDVAGGTPAIVDRPVGLGRTMAITIPLDFEWSDWAGSNPTYAMAMTELASWIARKPADDGSLAVGQPIELHLDAQRFRRDVKIGFIPSASRDENNPKSVDKNTDKVAAKDVKTEQALPDETGRRLDLKFAETVGTGYYNVETVKLDGEVVRTLYAANVDPTEGELARADKVELQTQLGDSAKIISGGPALGSGSEGAKREYSYETLYALLGVLGVEQLLAWWFGKRRG
jgi:hypothetical protein